MDGRGSSWNLIGGGGVGGDDAIMMIMVMVGGSDCGVSGRGSKASLLIPLHHTTSSS